MENNEKSNKKLTENKTKINKDEPYLNGDEEIKKLFEIYRKLLNKNKVELNIGEINFLKKFCKID